MCNKLLLLLLIVGFHFVTLYFRLVQVSTVYNDAIATSNTEIIVNSVVVLFIMDLDEYIFALLEACNAKWTGHASDSDSEDNRSDEEARNVSSITEMKEEIARQKTQIASQQEELMRQRDQVAKQNDEITKLCGIVQQIQGSLMQSIPQSQSPLFESVTTQTSELEDASLERDAGRDGSVDEVEDLNQLPKDETAFEMREQVIGRRRLLYPMMQNQNEFEEPRGEESASADADADPSDSENVDYESDKEAAL